MKHPKSLFQAGRIIAFISAILLAIGALLPWGATDEAVIRGIKGDGQITIVIGIIAMIILTIKQIPIWITLILGAIAGAIGIIVLVALIGATAETGVMGSGIYLTVAAASGMVIGTIVELIQCNKT